MSARHPLTIGRRAPVIGLRWRPGMVERHDSGTGLYECMNSPITSYAEVPIQRALLAPVSPRAAHRIAEAATAKRVGQAARAVTTTTEGTA